MNSLMRTIQVNLGVDEIAANSQYRVTVPYKINEIDCISRIERLRPKLVKGGKFFACLLIVSIVLSPRF